MYRETKEQPVTEIQHPCLAKWRGIIREARVRGRFNQHECSAAFGWDSCAVGEAMWLYLAKGDYHPVDFMNKCPPNMDALLKNFGLQFYEGVCHNDFDACGVILDAIERRLTEIL